MKLIVCCGPGYHQDAVDALNRIAEGKGASLLLVDAEDPIMNHAIEQLGDQDELLAVACLGEVNEDALRETYPFAPFIEIDPYDRRHDRRRSHGGEWQALSAALEAVPTN
jgi:hypothetical protein